MREVGRADGSTQGSVRNFRQDLSICANESVGPQTPRPTHLYSVAQRQDAPGGRTVMTTQTCIDKAGEMVVRDGLVKAEIGRTTEQFGLIAHVFSTYVAFCSRADTVPFQRRIN